MMNRDYENLLSEVVASEERRTASLEACVAAVRRTRRARRNVRWSLAAIAPALAATVYMAMLKDAPTTAVEVVQRGPAGPQMIPGTQIEVIDDQKLLSLFPDRAAALVGAGERQRFMLLDEQ